MTPAVALAAATAKTVAAVTAGATRVPTLTEIAVSFDGVNGSAVPVLVELVAGTAATAGASTAATPLLLRGDPSEAALATAGVNYTAEPTVLTAVKQWLVPPTSGLVIQLPLGREVTGTAAASSARKLLGLRVTAPAAVNVRASIEFEE